MDDDSKSADKVDLRPEKYLETSRRKFLKAALSAGATLPVWGIWRAALSQSQEVILENAKGMIVADSTRCVGCKLCELACTEYNEGRSQPSLARVKVSRNYNFGPRASSATSAWCRTRACSARILYPAQQPVPITRS
jgi:NAD-dependent dihydropyrimidine dehydrogenase PreA subunit